MIMRCHDEKITVRNDQAYKAGRYLIRNFPEKYKGQHVVHQGIHYLEITHVKNGYGTFFRSLIYSGVVG